MNKMMVSVLMVLTLMVGTMGFANAALPVEATTMFTDLGTDAAAAIALGWPLMVIVTGGFILFNIVRRAARVGTK